MDKLTDDLLVEILSRVPYRSLRRFTCVSRHWRALIAHPDHRRRLPQTLTGFFHHAPTRRFINVSGTGPPLVDPSLAFLPDREREGLDLLDCCNGLLLCRCFRFADPNEFDYLVVNPAAEKWVAVPASRRRAWVSNKVETARLGFDPAVSSRFHVFEFQLHWVEDVSGYANENVLAVAIYSSEKGAWSHFQPGWRFTLTVTNDFRSVFVNGMLYVTTTECVIGAVGVDGKTWRIINSPKCKDSSFLATAAGFIGLSQGQLHFAATDDIVCKKLAIWVFEDRNRGKWTLKHTVSFEHLVRRKHVSFGFYEFIVVAIHPDRNMVFFVFGHDKTLMSYDMDSGKVSIIRNLGSNCSEYYCIPYVPLFS